MDATKMALIGVVAVGAGYVVWSRRAQISGILSGATSSGGAPGKPTLPAATVLPKSAVAGISRFLGSPSSSGPPPGQGGGGSALGAQVGAYAGAAAGTAACSAAGPIGAAASPLCGTVAGYAGAYLGNKGPGAVKDAASSAWGEVKSWF